YTTSMRPALIAGNRFRDNGTGGNVVGFDNWYGTFVGLNTLTAGTDAGDFVNPASNDYRVRSGSAGATAAGGGGAAGGRGGVGGSGVLQRPGRAGRF
ncbi:MAG: hypothetical protein KA020_14775, partial [Planctomycetes bacterium]|nr:hypothetical protein [Planctomycetota bacterium]